MTYSPAGSCTKTCLVPWCCWAQFSLTQQDHPCVWAPWTSSSPSSTRSSSSRLDSMDSDSWSFSTTGRFGEEAHQQTAPRLEWKSGPVRSVCVQHAEFLDSRTEWEPEPSALKLHSCGCSASALETLDIQGVLNLSFLIKPILRAGSGWPIVKLLWVHTAKKFPMMHQAFVYSPSPLPKAVLHHHCFTPTCHLLCRLCAVCAANTMTVFPQQQGYLFRSDKGLL